MFIGCGAKHCNIIFVPQSTTLMARFGPPELDPNILILEEKCLACNKKWLTKKQYGKEMSREEIKNV